MRSLSLKICKLLKWKEVFLFFFIFTKTRKPERAGRLGLFFSDLATILWNFSLTTARPDLDFNKSFSCSQRWNLASLKCILTCFTSVYTVRLWGCLNQQTHTVVENIRSNVRISGVLWHKGLSAHLLVMRVRRLFEWRGPKLGLLWGRGRISFYRWRRRGVQTWG